MNGEERVMLGMAPPRTSGIAVSRTCIMEAGSTFMEFETAVARVATSGVAIEATEIERHDCTS
jgi:hypothetical protein